MQQELEEKLAKDFPFMEKKPTLEEQEAEGKIYDLYGAFGCDCDNGWYELLHDLCAEITELYKRYDQPVDIVMDQVKEKYGTLRFYYHHEGKEKGISAIDFPGVSLRFSSKDSELHRQVAEIVDKWEKKSGEVCEKCGKAGVLRKDLSWILTLCDDCYGKIVNKRKE